MRALVNGPRLLLADEPTGSLDERSADALGELFVRLNEKESLAICLVTHSRRLARRMQTTYELRAGSLARTEGAPA